MSSEPLVSAIIPTYNRAHMVTRAIASVQRQTYGALEIVVVDDGSSDETAPGIQAIQDRRLRYIRHRANRGLPAARNSGIIASKGDYLAFLDDDDEWRADKIERQLAAIEGHDVVLCGALVNGVKLKLYRSSKVLLKDLRRDNHFDPSGLLVRADVMSAVRFDEELRHGEDWDIFIRLAEKYRVAYIREPLVLYNDGQHERMTSSTKLQEGSVLRERLAVFYKHREFFGDYWFRYQIARSLLTYIGTRENKLERLVLARRRCGTIAVAAVLLDKAWANISALTVSLTGSKAKLKQTQRVAGQVR